MKHSRVAGEPLNTMEPTTTELVQGIAWVLKHEVDVQPFMDSLSNDELVQVTRLVDRMSRALHNELSKTKRQVQT